MVVALLPPFPSKNLQTHLRDQCSSRSKRHGNGLAPLSSMARAGRFPSVSVAPGLYRLRLIDPSGSHVYIGETDNLQRRFAHYRNPGPTQATNVRINEIVRAHLAAGHAVELDVIGSDVALCLGANHQHLVLSDKVSRRLLEYAALVVGGAIDVESLNR